MHRLRAVRAGERRVVDERAVRVGELGPGELVELGERADRVGVAFLAAPHGQRRAPVALARDRPVDVVLEPVAEAAVFDVLRGPVDRLVRGEQPILYLAGGDVPRGLGVVEQRRVAAPAVRIGVLERLGSEDAAARAEVLDQVRVGVLDLTAGIGPDPLVVGAVEPDRVDHLEAVLLAEAEVVLAERDRRVDEAGAVVRGDEVAKQDGMTSRAVADPGDERERGLVGDPLELPAREAAEDVRARALAEDPLDQGLGDDVDLVLVPHADIDELGVDRDRRVGDERPRCGGPDEQLIAGLRCLVALGDRQAHVHGRIDHILIHARLAELVARERDLVAWAVRDHLELLVQQPLSWIVLSAHHTDSTYLGSSVR